MLSDALIERLIDGMVMWEGEPCLSEKWPTLLVFLPKPDGSGVRPIALICSVLRAWAKEEVARNPEAAKDAQMQEAQTTMQVKALNDCEVKRKTGYLVCDTVLSVPSRPEDIKTEFTFALERAGWRYVPR